MDVFHGRRFAEPIHTLLKLLLRANFTASPKDCSQLHLDRLSDIIHNLTLREALRGIEPQVTFYPSIAEEDTEHTSRLYSIRNTSITIKG